MVRTFEDKVNSAPLDEEWLDRLNEANERVQGELYIMSWIIDFKDRFPQAVEMPPISLGFKRVLVVPWAK